MWKKATIEGTPKRMVRQEGTNIVGFPGINYENGRKPLLIVRETRQVVVVKLPGGKHWSGIGNQENHQAEYMVLLKLEDDTEPGVEMVMEIVSTPVRTSNEVDSDYHWPKV